ncbi:hypothetical protein AB0M36_30375 [Actinoplanes sp. NPDC051346]|uniref:hypothetical protein n=1 Tax=Actinoplanes sp. NPDC051346 TaxID=3155048 RepID=UPI00341BF26C
MSIRKGSATFTFNYPQWRGYRGGPTGGAMPDAVPYNSNTQALASLVYRLERLQDKRVVATRGGETRMSNSTVSMTFPDLEKNRAYVLRTSSSNGWGTCARQDGRILLQAR